MATLKAILDAVMGESGFLIPASYANSPNPDDVQMLHLANAASDEIAEFGLSGTRRFWSLTLDSPGTYALPPDFLAYVPDTAWVGSRKVDLPTTAQDWAAHQALGSNGSEWRARFLDVLNALSVGSGETMTFEYVSNCPWEDANGIPIAVASADSDRWLLDRRLLVLGTKWRWKKEKGVEDWTTDQQLYQRHLSFLRGRDGGSKTLNFGIPQSDDLIPYTNLWIT